MVLRRGRGNRGRMARTVLEVKMRGLVIILLICTSAAFAENTNACPTLSAIQDGAGTDDIANAIGADQCASELRLDGTSASVCQWEFPFRAPSASGRFDTLLAEIRSCLGPNSELPEDLQVNHPDSYDLRQFRSGDTVVSLSIKDKSALEKTFVFLRQ